MNRLMKKIKTAGRSPLLGVTAHTYNPMFVEMAAYLGFHAIWIEMEHMPNDFGKVADLCRIASGAGMLTMIRIPDARRDNVLKAAECDPDIIDLPMGNSPETLAELVRHARYAPEGERGFFFSSRATKYGLADSVVDQQRRINEELCLMAQVETVEAVENLDDLCAVTGIDAIFIGPGDLSASMGLVGGANTPSVMSKIEHIIEVAKGNGKLVALPHNPAYLDKWARCGVDLFFCGSDISCLGMGLRSIMEQVQLACAKLSPTDNQALIQMASQTDGCFSG